MATIRWYVIGDQFGAGFNNCGDSGSEPDHYPFNLLCAYVDTPGVIVWTPTWTPVTTDAPPAMSEPYGPVPDGDYSPGGVGQPFAQGVGFQIGGSDYGTLVLTCTVDGVPCDNALIAASAPGGGMYADLSWGGLGTPQIGWLDEIDNSPPGNADIEATGTNSIPSPFGGYFAGVVNYLGGTVVWDSDWTPAVASASPSVTPESGGKVSVSSDGFPIKYGTLLLTATVGGIPAEGVLRIVFTNDGGDFSYGTAAWDRIVPSTPAFWAGFNNTYEVI